MTEPADYAGDELLPGLEPDRPRDSELVKATRRSIRALEAAGYLDETHAGRTRLLIELAMVVDAGVRQGKASAAAMAAAQILATYEQLVPEAKEGDGDAYLELVAEIRRSATAPRDTT